MTGLVYTDSAGERVKNPDAKFMHAAMRGECYQRGSYAPEGELMIGNPARSCLLISRHPSRGWYLEYSKYEEPEQKLVAVQPGGDRETWVEHWMGGETSYFLAACFVPQTLADQAVAEFMASGKASPALMWEPIDWRLHHREDPPDDEAAVVEPADPSG